MPKPNISFDVYKVWFLTGSVGLYGEDAIRQVAEQSEAVVAQLNAHKDIPIEIIWKPVVLDTEALVYLAPEAVRYVVTAKQHHDFQLTVTGAQGQVAEVIRDSELAQELAATAS